MDPLDLARWQFGSTTVHPFLFVPVTLGLSAIAAIYQTARARNDNPQWLWLTEFLAKPAPEDSGIEVRAVMAAWGDHTVLDGPSLRVPAGRRVGVAGPSGSGKSTLAALLLRFVDPEDGTLRLGGVDLPRLALDDVRRVVGLVDDDPHVFATTLAENIRLARPGAGDEDVVAALRSAGLGGWLDGPADGLDTRLGDGCLAGAGGEHARLAVARSLLADQRVLVLDEPTAHLDDLIHLDRPGEVSHPRPPDGARHTP